MHYRTIIISDLHLGSPDAKYKELKKFLKENTCDTLILNGDIIDWLYLSFFPKEWKQEHTETLKEILDCTKKWTKITYIKGNHDQNWHKRMKVNRANINICSEIIYESWSKRYLICHGQQLDKKPIKWIETIWFLSGVFIYRLNRIYNKRRSKYGLKYISIVSKVKDFGKWLMVGNSTKVEDRIKQLCIEKNVDGFICWHLHHPRNTNLDKFHYLNSWDWIESMSAVVEDTDHQRNILEYKQKLR